MMDAFNGTFLVDEIDSAINPDGVIIGIPLEDGIQIYQKGTEKAPQVIREQSQFFSGQGVSQQSIHSLNVLDLGDHKNKTEQENLIEKILNKNAIPVILGGDHSIALNTANGIRKAKTKIEHIIWVDAHLDLMDKYPDDNKYSRATILKRIIDLDFIEPNNIYFIGVRGHNIGLEEIETIQELNISYITADEVKKEQQLGKFLKNITAGKNDLYVSLDIDVLDPAFAPGVSVPEPGGLTSRELFDVIRILANNIKCLEIVEVNPLLDAPNNITSKIACSTIYHLFDNINK